jgi:hypothetical protein
VEGGEERRRRRLELCSHNKLSAAAVVPLLSNFKRDSTHSIYHAKSVFYSTVTLCVLILSIGSVKELFFLHLRDTVKEKTSL